MPPTPANLIWIMPAEGNGLESYITVMPSILIVDGYFFCTTQNDNQNEIRLLMDTTLITNNRTANPKLFRGDNPET